MYIGERVQATAALMNVDGRTDRDNEAFPDLSKRV